MEALIILIFAVTNIGTLLLVKNRLSRDLAHGPDDDMSVVVVYQALRPFMKEMRERLDRIDHDHQQIKTRLADEERQNQKDLARARYERRKEAGETDSAK